MGGEESNFSCYYSSFKRKEKGKLKALSRKLVNFQIVVAWKNEWRNELEHT